MDSIKEKAKDLTLMLLYLTSWEERGIDAPRSWKSYDFGIMDELIDDGFIYGSRKAKSVYIDESGVLRAKALLAKYGINVE